MPPVIVLLPARSASRVLHNTDLELAKKIAADVIENSGIALYDRYEDLFKYKHNNNPESLIAMQWVPLGDWGVCRVPPFHPERAR